MQLLTRHPARDDRLRIGHPFHVKNFTRHHFGENETPVCDHKKSNTDNYDEYGQHDGGTLKLLHHGVKFAQSKIAVKDLLVVRLHTFEVNTVKEAGETHPYC